MKQFCLLVVVLLLLFSPLDVVTTSCGSSDSESKKTDVKGWAAGVGMCVTSAFCSVVGVTLQKKCHVQNLLLPEDQRRSYLRFPVWWVGISFVIGGAILDFLSLGFAPQSVVACLGSLTIVMNVCLAPFWLGETVTRKELAGSLCIVGGAALSVSASSQRSQNFTRDELMCLFEQKSFLIYAAFTGAFLIFLCSVFRYADIRVKREEKQQQQHPENHTQCTWIHKARLFSITSISGTLGAQSLLFGKAVSTIARGAYAPTEDSDGMKGLTYYETYLLLLGMIFTVITQTHTLNMALERFDSVVVLPLFQVFWILLGVVGAGAYFQEFSAMTPLGIGLFPVGVLMISCGIFALSGRAKMDVEAISDIIDNESPPEESAVACYPPNPLVPLVGDALNRTPKSSRRSRHFSDDNNNNNNNNNDNRWSQRTNTATENTLQLPLQQFTGQRSNSNNNQQPTESNQQPTENNQQTTDNKQQTTDNNQEAANNKQQETDNKELTTDSININYCDNPTTTVILGLYGTNHSNNTSEDNNSASSINPVNNNNNNISILPLGADSRSVSFDRSGSRGMVRTMSEHSVIPASPDELTRKLREQQLQQARQNTTTLS